MQFLTATWAAWGIDASGDRLASPHNAYDAIATAGRYLCNGQPRLDSITIAVRRYNPSERYVTEVLAKAHSYGTTDDRGDPAPQRPPVIDAVGGPVVHGDARRVVDFAIAQLGKPYVNIHVPASTARAWRGGDRPRGRAAWCSEARVGFRLVRCASVLVASRGCR
jgi:hypothetical protein